MCQKSRACYSSRDRPAWRFRLHDPLTTRTSQLRPNLADHFEVYRFDFQDLRTSSPRCFSLPPQSGQASCFGKYVRTSRGSCEGSGRRADRAKATAFAMGSGRAATFSASFCCNASSRSSNCSIWRSNFSDFRPNCMRRSLAISSFSCSISLSRDTISSCWEMIRTFSSWGSSASRSGKCRAWTSRCAVRHEHNSWQINSLSTASHGHLWIVAAYGTPPIDPFQQHRQLCRCQSDGSARCLRPEKFSPLESFCEKAQTIHRPTTTV